MKPISLAIGDSGVTLIYLQLKPRMENNKYVDNEFMLLGLSKGKQTMENVPLQILL